ncbi:MAG: hypothetical protein WBG70_00820 [Spirulinaceae cyanobacterium]
MKLKRKGRRKKVSPGQMSLPWERWEVLQEEVAEVAKQFVLVNCYDPKTTSKLFENPYFWTGN